MLVKRELILLKIESAYNTDALPVAGTDALLVGNPSWTHEGARMIDRNLIRSSLDTPQKLYGGSLMSVSFEVEMKGSGTIDAPPEMGAALRACGFGETITLSTSVAYKPVSTALESATIYYYQDGKRHVLTGCLGNVTFNWTTGSVPMATFTFTGHIGTPTDVPLPAGTFDSTVPLTLRGLSSFVIGGYAAVINALEFSMNNEIATPPSIGAPDGYGQVRIVSRDVSGSFDPEDVLLATKDFIAEWKAGTTSALDTGEHGTAVGNRIRIQHPAVAYRDISQADRDAVRTLGIGYGAGISAGDDEVTITFT